MTTTLLRIAALISLLFSVGHLAGGLRQWSPMGPDAVLDAMTGTRFTVLGASRSYLDFFMGFGWSIGVAGLLQTALLWQLAGVAQASPALARPLILSIAVATVATGAIAWRFIFVVPALFCFGEAAVVAAAWIAARRA